MKRYLTFGLIILMLTTLVVGCSGGTKEANAPALEQQKAKPNEPAEDDSKAEEPKAEESEAVKSSKPTQEQADPNGAEPGHTLKATYPAHGHKLLVEVDQSKEVVKGVPVNYLYIEYGDNGMKRLLAQSVDRGNDWTNSVANILNPTISKDETKVYFETDDTFTRTSGYGASNHRTYWIDLGLNMETIEHYYFEEGGIKKLLDSSYGSYADHLILEINSLDTNGQPTHVYQVVSPEGEQVVVLDSFAPDMDFVNIINTELQGNNAPGQNEDSALASTSNEYLTVAEVPHNGVYIDDLKVNYHGEYIEHMRYAAVVVEDYPDYEGNYPFKYRMHFENPAYSDRTNTYNFAVMGEVYNVWIKSKAQMDSTYTETKIADKLEDTLIEVESSFPTDFSVDVLTFEDYNGKTYEIPIEDMSDNKEVIAIKLPY